MRIPLVLITSLATIALTVAGPGPKAPRHDTVPLFFDHASRSPGEIDAYLRRLNAIAGVADVSDLQPMRWGDEATASVTLDTRPGADLPATVDRIRSLAAPVRRHGVDVTVG